ncbi:T9SS type A sorting domain-containing protein [Winogradskyella sp. A2]|uniref:T9SS type A sorting domain-containing protein n=1 Tax=Winogradskyella sp. A2 TaxID=3366944 RepID=UPI00398C762B
MVLKTTVNYNRRLLFLFFLIVFITSNSLAQTTTWTGAIGTDWFDPGNWSDGVPDANDDVDLQDATNDPVISGTTALANSVLVNENIVLTIDATGTLEVDLVSTTFAINAITVLGTINNSGTISIGATSNSGQRGLVIGQATPSAVPGTFNNLNGSLVQIDNFSFTGIGITSAAGNSFTNDGIIEIGMITGTSHGILGDTGTFTNGTNGVITLENLTGNSIWIFKNFIFENNGSINIGLDSASGGSFSIDNAGTFSNMSSGNIDIRGFTNRGIYARSGTEISFPGEFNNSGVINLDGEVGAGAYGIVVQGEFSTFNNLTGGSINVTDVSTLGISAGFGGVSDFGSVFNNSGNINTLGDLTTTNQGVGVWDGTFNHNNGIITVDNADFAISLFTGGTSTFNNSSTIVAQNLPFATSDLVYGDENSFVNNPGGSIFGTGEIEIFGPYVNNGGSFNPGDAGSDYGLIRFKENADLGNSIINLDINGNTTPGIDFDKIEIFAFQEQVLNLGGTLNLNITYTPIEDVEYITIFEAPVINGEFTTVNGLPSNEWNILYNFPDVGQVSIEYGAINSVQSGPFSDPNTWANGLVPNADTPAIVEGTHVVTIDVPSIQVARLQVTDNATVIIPPTTTLMVSESEGPAIINDGNIQIDGNVDITFPTQAGIVNSGTMSLDGEISVSNTETAIVNTDTFMINEDGVLNIDFTINAAIESQSGSEFTNNGLASIGLDPTGGNSVGLYAIDLEGYFENTATGILEIQGTTDAAILLPDGVTTLTGRNPNDGIFLNNGILRLDALQTGTVQQSDNAAQMKGKYTHVLKKRPQPNPGRDITEFASYLNELFSFLTGSGIIDSDITSLNGGTISPGILDGEEGIIIFDGSEDFQNVTLDIDVNGKTLKGTDYDLIAVIGTATLGGDLKVDFNYTPTEGDIITIIEADDIVGTFNNPTLPMDWTVQYNNPSQGKVSLQFGDALSIDENPLNDLKIYNLHELDVIVIEGLLISATKIDLFDISGRRILQQELDVSSNINKINVSALASGTYVIKIKTGYDITKTQKIIIN